MQSRSTCGVGPYKQFWTWGITDGIKASTLVARVRGGVYQGVVLDICHICGELPRASALKGVNVTPQPFSSL